MSDQLEREIRRQTEALFGRLPPVEDLLPAELAEEAGVNQSPAGTVSLTPSPERKKAQRWLLAAAVAGAILLVSVPAGLWLTRPQQETVTPALNAPLEPPRQGMVQNPANGHFYEVVSLTGSLIEANAEAMAKSFRGSQGHIVTISSRQEDDFIREAFAEAFDAGPGGPYLGGFQPEGSAEPGGGWQWVTREPFEFTDWVSGEPNDAVDEACIEHIEWPEPGWNDIPCPETGDAYDYIIEYDVER